jgi:hypothetical protein
MPKIIDYRILTDISDDGDAVDYTILVDRVRYLISRGWQPYGPLQTGYHITGRSARTTETLQAMVKYE